MQFIKHLLSFIFKLLGLLLLVLIFYFSMPIQTTKSVVLPKGSVTKTVEALKEQGYAVNHLDTYFLAYFLNSPKSGTLNIGGEKMSRISFLKKLSSAKEAINIITLIPGETKVVFLKTLAENQALSLEKLNKAYDKFSSYKEAGILPDTYHLPKNSNEENLMKILISQTEKKYKELSVEHYKKYDKKEWNKILTVASIVQKEAANKKEMPVVASVVFNRLKIDMPLQMDGTLNYGKYSHVKVTPKRIKTDKSPFNTYAHRGLPPYAISSVSIEAIKAALNPAKTSYLYFMKNKSGVHDFTSSYQEHLRNIRKAKH